MTSGAITMTCVFNDAGQMLSESFSGGPLDGLTVTNMFDALQRRTNVTILNAQAEVLASTAYGYAEGRLQSVSEGSNSVTYSYVANSPLVEQLEFKQGTTTRMTTTKNYDLLNRLTGISSAPSASSAVSFNYAYNSANQRLSPASEWRSSSALARGDEFAAPR